MIKDIAVPETNTEAISAVAKARALTIASNSDYIAADAVMQGLRALDKNVDEAYDEHIADAFRAHRGLVAKKKKYAEPIEEARRIIKGKMIEWADKQAEIDRREAEQRARAEKDRADAEALARAQALEAAGQQDAAMAVVEEAAMMPQAPAAVVKSTPKVATVTRTIWSAQVTDDRFVLRAIEAAGNVLAKVGTPEAIAAAATLRQAYMDAQYMAYNTTALNSWATSTKGAVRLGGAVAVSRKV